MSTSTAKVTVPVKNFFARLLGKPDTAIARWREHLERARAIVDRQDRDIIGENERLKGAMERAANVYQVARTAENYQTWVAARNDFHRNDEHFLIWSRDMSGQGAARLDALIDERLAQDAITEARLEIGTARHAAEQGARETAEAAGVTPDSLLAEITRRYAERERNLEAAQASLRNLAVTDRTCHPRGKATAGSYLDSALRP